MTNNPFDEVEVQLAVSPGRRMLGVGSVTVLGLIMLYLAFVQPPDPAWQGFLIVFAVLSLWMALRMWRATAHRLELTSAGLHSSDGRLLAAIEDVVAVERGVFAFKPSNGFILKLSRKGPVAWEPGLWWRIGRRVGVGGVTDRAPARMMAELMHHRISNRPDG